MSIDGQPNLVSALWRYKWLILGVTVLAAVVAYGLSSLQPTRYEAEGRVLLNDPRSSGLAGGDIGVITDADRYVRNQAEVMASPQVAAGAAEILGDGTTVTELEESVEVTAASDANALTVRATAPTAEESVARVDAIVLAYEGGVRAQVEAAANASIATLESSKLELEVRIAELDAALAEDPANSTLEARRTAAVTQLISIDTRIEQISTNAALYGSGVQLYVPPDLPDSPVSPQPTRDAAIAAVLGAFGAGVWAWWRADRNQVADDRHAPAHVLDAPLLATIPVFTRREGDLPVIANPESPEAEAYRFAASSTFFALENVKGTTVLVTSPNEGDGKTVTAVNLAAAAADEEGVPVLIDGDTRVRGLTARAGLNGAAGLTELSSAPENVVHRWEPQEGIGISIVPAGTRGPATIAGMVRSESFEAALADLESRHSITIIDSPPVLAAAETADMAALCDGVVLVITQGTPMRVIAEAAERVTMSGAPIVGYVFNRATGRNLASRYGYPYGGSA